VLAARFVRLLGAGLLGRRRHAFELLLDFQRSPKLIG
jgi:hypothetical protein